MTRFHLMGGHCNHCLSESISSIVAAKLTEDSREPVNIYLYSSQSYVRNTMGAIVTAASALQSFQKRAQTLISESIISSELPLGARMGRAAFSESDAGPSYRIPITGTTRPINIYVLPQ